MENMTPLESFASASQSFIQLVARIGPDQWDAPGLGSWNVRALVGHTRRAILTVGLYLDAPEPAAATVADAVHYYPAVFDGYTDHEAVAERGERAGRELPADPVAELTELREHTLAFAGGMPAGRLVPVGPLAVPLPEYLRTRVFELTVHVLDLSRATGIDHTLDAEVLADSAALAARVAALRGTAGEVLFALTGRSALPAGFSIF